MYFDLLCDLQPDFFYIDISTPFSEFNATLVLASYVVLKQAFSTEPKNNSVNGSTFLKSSDFINACNVTKAFDNRI